MEYEGARVQHELTGPSSEDARHIVAVGRSLRTDGPHAPGATAPIGAGWQEYSLAQALMRRIETEAAARGAVAVERVILRIGDLSGIDIDVLATAYLTFRNRTVCARAPLEITPVRPEWRCRVCDRQVQSRALVRCRACGGATRLRGGDEVVLERLELELA